MESFSSFVRKREVVQFLLDDGRDPLEHDVQTMSERWDTLKKGVALGALSLAPFLATSGSKKSDKPNAPTVREVEPAKTERPDRVGGIDREEFERRAADYSRMIKELRKKPRKELTNHERKLLGEVW